MFYLDLWPRNVTLTPTLIIGPKQDNWKEKKNMPIHDLLLFDLDLWPVTLTYNHKLGQVKVDLCTFAIINEYLGSKPKLSFPLKLRSTDIYYQ